MAVGKLESHHKFERLICRYAYSLLLRAGPLSSRSAAQRKTGSSPPTRGESVAALRLFENPIAHQGRFQPESNDSSPTSAAEQDFVVGTLLSLSFNGLLPTSRCRYHGNSGRLIRFDHWCSHFPQ
jgi:hypothetical protein